MHMNSYSIVTNHTQLELNTDPMWVPGMQGGDAVLVGKVSRGVQETGRDYVPCPNRRFRGHTRGSKEDTFAVFLRPANTRGQSGKETSSKWQGNLIFQSLAFGGPRRLPGRFQGVSGDASVAFPRPGCLLAVASPGNSWGFSPECASWAHHLSHNQNRSDTKMVNRLRRHLFLVGIVPH